MWSVLPDSCGRSRVLAACDTMSSSLSFQRESLNSLHEPSIHTAPRRSISFGQSFWFLLVKYCRTHRQSQHAVRVSSAAALTKQAMSFPQSRPLNFAETHRPSATQPDFSPFSLQVHPLKGGKVDVGLRDG
eukprot:1928081-Rhodomonas_salina.5